jgi:hypothetical protein
MQRFLKIFCYMMLKIRNLMFSWFVDNVCRPRVFSYGLIFQIIAIVFVIVVFTKVLWLNLNKQFQCKLT